MTMQMRRTVLGALSLGLLASAAYAAGSTAPGIVQSGAVTAGHCAQFSASGVAIDSGAACGVGTAGVTQFSAGTTGLTPSTGTTGAITLGGTLAVANGGTGATALGSEFTNATTLHIGSAGVTNAMLANPSMTIGGQAVSLGGATANQGTGAKLQLSTGTTTSGDCVQFDASGNTIDAGAACGTGGGGGTPGNPTATAGPTAINGVATTYMRSDAAPAIQKGTNAQFGLVEGDGSTLSCTAGVCSVIGGGSVSITAGNGILVNPSPITGTGTVSTTNTVNAQTGTTYATASTDGGKTVSLNNASAIAVSLSQATTTGFGNGFATTYDSIGAGTTTITPTTSTIDGLASLALTKGQGSDVWSDGTNYHAVVGMPQLANNTLLGNSSGSSNYPTAQTVGTGVITALGVALSGAGGVTSTIANGTAAMGTSAISSATCATVVTVAATNVATTDVITAGFNGDPTAVTGYTPSASGMLTIISYPTSGNVNFKVCNNTSGSITPGAVTLNWRVVR